MQPHCKQSSELGRFPSILPNNFHFTEAAALSCMDTGQFRPLGFSMHVANPKLVGDHHQFPLHKEQTEP